MPSKTLENTFILCFNEKIEDSQLEFLFRIMILQNGRKIKAKIKLEEDFSDNDLEYFKIIELPNAKRNKKNLFYFCIYSHKRRMLVNFDANAQKLEILKITYNRMEQDLNPVFCSTNKVMYVPSEKFLEIWDRTCSHKIYSIELENTIKAFLPIPEKNLVILYDKYK